MATRHEKLIKKCNEVRAAEVALIKIQKEYQLMYFNEKDD